MTEAIQPLTIQPLTIQPLTIQPLTILGDQSAAACDGEFCAIPEHPEQAIVNRRLDDDAV
jgi:hypothetical protein